MMFIKMMETLLHKKSDNFKFLTSFSLDIRAWSTETQTNIALLLYSGVLTYSAQLVSLYTHWKYLKLSFFDVSTGYRKRYEMGLRTLKSTRSQMFFRVGVLKNFAIFKRKQLRSSLFFKNSQTCRPATQVFSFEYCKIFKNSFFDRTPPVAAFGPRHTFTMKLFLWE